MNKQYLNTIKQSALCFLPFILISCGTEFDRSDAKDLLTGHYPKPIIIWDKSKWDESKKDVQIGEVDFVEITGITDESIGSKKNTKKIEYKTIIKIDYEILRNIGGDGYFGEYGYYEKNHIYGDGKISDETAYITKYDDGWRLKGGTWDKEKIAPDRY